MPESVKFVKCIRLLHESHNHKSQNDLSGTSNVDRSWDGLLRQHESPVHVPVNSYFEYGCHFTRKRSKLLWPSHFRCRVYIFICCKR